MVSNTLITAAGTIGESVVGTSDTSDNSVENETAGDTVTDTTAEDENTAVEDTAAEVEDTTVEDTSATDEWQGYKSPKYVYLQALLIQIRVCGGGGRTRRGQFDVCVYAGLRGAHNGLFE